MHNIFTFFVEKSQKCTKYHKNSALFVKKGDNMNNTIICSNLTTGTDNVVLIPNQTIKNLVNTGNYRLIIACNIPEATANYPVFIQVGENNIPVLCKYGNQIYANQLNRRVNYPIGYGDQNAGYTNGQFVILSCCNINPRGTVTTTTTEVNPNQGGTRK